MKTRKYNVIILISLNIIIYYLHHKDDVETNQYTVDSRIRYIYEIPNKENLQFKIHNHETMEVECIDMDTNEVIEPFLKELDFDIDKLTSYQID